MVARNTAFAFKGQSVDVKDVAKQLGVDHVLEGSVRKAGNRVRITAQLIDGRRAITLGRPLRPRPHRHLRDPGRNFQGDRQALQLSCCQEEQAIESRGTERVEAYNLYLMARQQWIRGHLGQHPARRDRRADLQAGRDVRPRLCRSLGADGAGAGRAAFWHGEDDDPLPAAERAMQSIPLGRTVLRQGQGSRTTGPHEEADKQLEEAFGSADPGK